MHIFTVLFNDMFHKLKLLNFPLKLLFLNNMMVKLAMN
jgi:hypothetical protein